MTDVNVLMINNQAHIRTPEDLLTEVLPQLLEAVDTVRNATLYRLSRGGLVVWHSTDNPERVGTFVDFETNSSLQEAVNQKQPILNEESHLVIAPMISDGNVFALLEVDFEGEIHLEPILQFADALNVVLYNRHLHRLLQKQISVTALLNEAESLTDVAKIIAQTMAEPEQYIGMNIFEFDAQKQVKAIRVITTANRHDAFKADVEIPISQEGLKTVYDMLKSEGDILIGDILTDFPFSEATQQWLVEQKAKSAYLISMPIAEDLFAFLSLIDTGRSLALTDMESLLFKNVTYQAGAVIEKQELLEKTRRSAERSDEQVRIMSLLNELIQQINTEQDETRILDITANTLLEASQSDHIGIVMFRDSQGFVVSEAPHQGMIGFEIGSGVDSVNELLKKQRKPLVILDVAEDSTLPQKTRDDMNKIGTKSVIFIPMFDLNNRLLGTVGVDYYTKQDTISSTTVDNVQTIVTQVASNILRVRLLSQSQQQAKQLQHITDFGQKLRAYLGIEEIVETALLISQDLLVVDYVAIMIYDRQADSLRCVGEVHNGEKWISIPGNPIDAEADKIASQAWERREMMYVDDVHADWEWKHPKEQALQTVLAQPLSSAGVMLGVMEIGHRSPSAYNTVDVTTFQQMSNQLAIALSNAEAYAQSQKLARNKSLANDIITRIQQQPDVKSILEVTVHELGQALQAKRGRIRLGTVEQKTSGES